MADGDESSDELIHVFWHDGMLAHTNSSSYGVFDTLQDPGFLDVLEPHPENADRVRNMKSILQRGPISPYIRFHQGRAATQQELLYFHTPEYVQELIAAGKSGGKFLCSGTCLNVGSWEAALLAAGSTCKAMQHILDGHAKLAYALVRPPGHHAQPSHADGYCFLNNAGIAVHVALMSGYKRIAVIDIDVHYGNGTAEGFYERDDVLTVSLHMNHGSWGPSHPQTGQLDEVGRGKGIGFNLNIPLPNGSGDQGYEYAMEELVVPALGAFKPEMLVLVMGQDSSAFDPNGRQCITMEGYRKVAQIIRQQAELHTGGKVLVVQEGGYHLTYAAYCLHAALEGLLSLPQALLSDPIAYYPEDETFAVERVKQIKYQYNSLVQKARTSSS
ncbi:hypothetical protein O6H91_01G155900 [Diphasiastrum complanatum]|uniref:Uncharacterized protein n=2 Tax=Diphasiastrum complanatum TaxID=34168 RepID=A0ACC2EXH7_DIPCM|nr:hypothetical protein O6H91_01G155900 [Diphasiastrum complanatum]